MGGLTVAELIEKLGTLPRDLKVVIWTDGDDIYETIKDVAQVSRADQCSPTWPDGLGNAVKLDWLA